MRHNRPPAIDPGGDSPHSSSRSAVIRPRAAHRGDTGCRTRLVLGGICSQHRSQLGSQMARLSQRLSRETGALETSLPLPPWPLASLRGLADRQPQPDRLGSRDKDASCGNLPQPYRSLSRPLLPFQLSPLHSSRLVRSLPIIRPDCQLRNSPASLSGLDDTH